MKLKLTGYTVDIDHEVYQDNGPHMVSGSYYINDVSPECAASRALAMFKTERRIDHVNSDNTTIEVTE